MFKIATLATTTVLVLSGGSAAFAHQGPSPDRSDDGVRIVRGSDDPSPSLAHTRHARHAEPGDDHGRHAEPGDDHGRNAEPGDDHGGRHGGGHGSDD